MRGAVKHQGTQRARPAPSRRLLLVIAALFLGVAILGAPSGAAEGRAVVANPEFQRILNGLVSGRGRIAPGVTAYVSGPHGTWTGAAGVANVKTGEPMRPDARMRLESVSKLWTATLILRLAQQHRLSLDDTVERWLPGLLPAGHRITVRQLLNHTSGLIDTNDITQHPTLLPRPDQGSGSPRQDRDNQQDERRRTLATSSHRRLWVEVAAALPLLLPPGSAYHYSNIGYMVAGLVAERAGKQPLPTLFRTQIIAPLHLTSQRTIRTRRSPAPTHTATGSPRTASSPTQRPGHSASAPTAASSPPRQTRRRFLTALMRGALLGPAQLAALKKPSAYSNYGLGTGVDKSGCAGTAYGHNGGGDGFETNVFVSGNGDRVAVLLLNGRTADNSGDAVAFMAMNKLYCAA